MASLAAPEAFRSPEKISAWMRESSSKAFREAKQASRMLLSTEACKRTMADCTRDSKSGAWGGRAGSTANSCV
eukprot:9200169-Alexandrium_andersonii.AAC.1